MKITPDLEIAKAFIEALTGSPDTVMTFQTFSDDKENKLHEHTRILHGSLDEVGLQLIDLNKRGAGVFVCPNITDGRGRGVENVVSVRAIYIDNDDGTPSEFKVQPNIRVITAQGSHQYWKLAEAVDDSRFNLAVKLLIPYYGADPAVKRANSVLRLPGFFHQKNKDNPLLITFVDLDQPLVKYEELVEKHKAVGKKSKLARKHAPTSSDPTDVASISIEPGRRNSTTFKLVRSCIARGMPKEDVRDTVLKYVSRCSEHPDSSTEPFTNEEALEILEAQWTHPERDKFFAEDTSSDLDAFTLGNSTYRYEFKGGEQVPVRCADFKVKILEEKTYDNGVDEYKELAVLATAHDGREITTTVPAAEFSNKTWVDQKLGADFVVEPTRWEKFVASVKKLSRGFNRTTHYARTGFGKIGGKLIFLMPNGSISKDGFSSEPKTTFQDRVVPPFEVSEPLGASELPAAKKLVLSFLSVAPPEITLCLLAAMARAPLNPIKLVDFAIFIEGATGTRKSTIAALLCGFLGKEFHRTKLATNFTSTSNAIEAVLFKYKDLIQVIDDFAPKGSSGDIAKYNQLADRVFRNIGNGSSRARMTVTGDLRPSLPPRGLVLATGEDVPLGHSILARLLVISLAPDSVDIKTLTQVQTEMALGIGNKIFSSYLQYLCRNWDRIERDLPQIFDLVRTAYMRLGSHSRFPENIANLYLGLHSFLNFCLSEKLLDETEAKTIKADWKRVVKVLSIREKALSKASDIALQFIDLILGAFDANKALLADPTTADQPKEPGIWGWSADGDTRTKAITFREGKAEKIGWVDDDYVYLMSKPSFAIAHEYAKSLGINFNITEQVLHKRLADKNLLITTEKDTFLTKVSAEKGRPRVLKFRKSTFRSAGAASDIEPEYPVPERIEVHHASH